MEDKSLIGFVAKSYDKNLFTYNLFSYAIFRLLKIVLALKWLFFCGLPSGRPGLEVWLSGEIIYHITWLTNHAWRLQPSWTIVEKYTGCWDLAVLQVYELEFVLCVITNWVGRRSGDIHRFTLYLESQLLQRIGRRLKYLPGDVFECVRVVLRHLTSGGGAWKFRD